MNSAKGPMIISPHLVCSVWFTGVGDPVGLPESLYDWVFITICIASSMPGSCAVIVEDSTITATHVTTPPTFAHCAPLSLPNQKGKEKIRQREGNQQDN